MKYLLILISLLPLVFGKACSLDCLRACRLSKNDSYFLLKTSCRCEESCGCNAKVKPTCVQLCLYNCSDSIQNCLKACNCPCLSACKQMCIRNKLGDDCLAMCGCFNLVSSKFLSIPILFTIVLTQRVHEELKDTRSIQKKFITKQKREERSVVMPFIVLGLIIAGLYAYSRVKTRCFKKKYTRADIEFETIPSHSHY